MITGHVSDTELAWAAGFFDGEGCFTMQTQQRKTKVPYIRAIAAIGQVDPEVLLRFQAAVAVGRVSGPWQRKGPRAKPVWTYRADGREVPVVYNALLPWLSTVKRDAGARVIALASPPVGKGWRRGRIGGWGGRRRNGKRAGEGVGGI